MSNNKKKADVSVVVMVLVIIAVLVLGGFAVAPRIKTIVETKQAQQLSERMQNGTATVEDLANSEGMQFDEYLVKYEVTDAGITKDTNMTDFMEKLTLKNYCTFAGVEYTDEALEEYKAIYEASEEATEDGEEDAEKEEKVEITADTTDMEAKYSFASYLYTLQQEELNGPVEVDPEAATDAEAEPEAE